MRIYLIITSIFLLSFLTNYAQESKLKKFKNLSGPEKCWVITHPFVAKKAFIITEKAREKTNFVRQNKLLKGEGNGDQIDAFRHAYWMATLMKEIGWNKAMKLGKAHEKGNFKDWKRRRKEDGVVPDEISSSMDLFNNIMGLGIGLAFEGEKIEPIIVEAIKNGCLKIIKTDQQGNFLDCEGNIIPNDSLNGKWKTNKCLVWSDQLPE